LTGKLINVKKSSKKILVVASTDMTHYEPRNYAETQDRLAIERMLELDGPFVTFVLKAVGHLPCHAPSTRRTANRSGIGSDLGIDLRPLDTLKIDIRGFLNKIDESLNVPVRFASTPYVSDHLPDGRESNT
jgi:hypothetical protein